MSEQTVSARAGALVISRTPLRVSFFGGGTDLPDYYREFGGRVLSFGLDRYVHVVVKRNWTDDLVVRCGGVQVAGTVGDVTHGIVREALRLGGHTGGLEIISTSDIPESGSGLGSSSAFTVGLLHALAVFRGETPSAQQLAELACHIEIDVLGEPIGKQDQYASAMGGCREYAFHPDDSVAFDAVPVPPDGMAELSRHSLMFYTGRTRRAADVLSDQRARIGTTKEYLHRMKEIVTAGRERLMVADIAGLGRLLSHSWETKKKLSDRIHDDHLNNAFDAAMAAGAYGGKLLGAGGGGFFFFLCPPERQEAVRNSLPGFRQVPVRLGVEGSVIIAGG